MKVCKVLVLLMVLGGSSLVQAAQAQQISSLYARFVHIDQLMQQDPVSYSSAHDCLQEMIGVVGVPERWNSFVKETSRNADGQNVQQLHELCEFDEDELQDLADAERLLSDVELRIVAQIRLKDH